MEAETLNKIRTLAEEGYSARYIIAMLKLPADVFEKDAEAAEHYAVGLQQNNKPDDEIEAEAESVSANRGGAKDSLYINHSRIRIQKSLLRGAAHGGHRLKRISLRGG